MTTLQRASQITTTPDDRVEQLRQKLGYPVQQRDPHGSDFFYLRPGTDAEEAEDTCPIAVGFYPELNQATDERSLQQLLTSPEWQQRIYGHYLSRTAEQQPVMYILMPTEEGTGQVPLILPTEGGLRQRNIQTFAWGSAELETRLNRLRQEELPVASRALTSVPLVERAFYKPIQTAKELAQLLATAARRIEQILPEVYQDEKRRYLSSKGEDGYLHQLLKSFQQELLPSLQLVSENEKDYSFSDIYAQTIAYSLFTARVFGYVRDRSAGQKEAVFDRSSAWQQLPETNPFLRKLFQDVSERSPEELGNELIGAIADIFAILRAAKMDVILQDFRQKQNREDIVIRFYEDFLAAYKPQMRERRGVYYTPEPVVSYMVRSVDVLLKEKFDKPLGLADPEVMILDPACGTGTFLLWICQLIHDRFHTEREAMIAKVGDISWSEYVSEHLLPRIFGFELLMAPYAIAHLKVGLFLEETGYQFNSGKRLEIYLTNTLDNPVKKSETFFGEFITEESDQASAIKRDKPVMVVIGNPPYSISSVNQGESILSLLKDYKKNLDEKKINLDDDYIKFIRFAQNRIDVTGYGILSFITNHSYLSGVVHRQMRKSLSKTFNNIYISDLHGNSVLKERTPEGGKDENVFDIQQGVSIFLGAKNDRSVSNYSEIKFGELFGLRKDKYDSLLNEDVATTTWKTLSPEDSDYFFFCEKDFSLDDEYNSNPSIVEIFPQYVSGIQTKRDSITICLDQSRLKTILSDLQSLPSEHFRNQYELSADGRDWTIDLARRNVENYQPVESHIKSILYRPFDFRFTYYTPKSKGFIAYPRYDVMKHMVLQKNLGLIVKRQMANDEISYFLVSDKLISEGAIGIDNKGREFLFPLFLYADEHSNQQLLLQSEPQHNIDRNVLEGIREKLGYTPDPKAILHYIYAIFYSLSYRNRYADFLRIDFPRIPFTSSSELFTQLAIYGEELVSLHLMKSPKLDRLITEFVDQGGSAIVDPAHPKYNNGSVIINKKGDRFVNVPEAVWNFHVGGYQVCAKWLKDRKGRILTEEDILHYQRIVVALQETIHLMQQIDEAIPEFPIA